MLWGCTCAPDGHIISVNCDHECLFLGERSKCDFEACPMRHHSRTTVNPGYTIDRWLEPFISTNKSWTKERCEELWQQYLNLQCNTIHAFGARLELKLYMLVDDEVRQLYEKDSK